MFIVAKQSKPFWYPVLIPVVDAGGTTREHKIEMLFKRFSREELAELRAESGDIAIDADHGVLGADVAYILKIAEGWRHVVDESKMPMDFTGENIRTVIDIAPAAAGKIVEKFFEATMGGGGRLGN